MNSFLLKTLKLTLILLILTACKSRINDVRETVNRDCSDLALPEKAKAYKADTLDYRGKSYILTEKYLYSQGHIIKLNECIDSLVCSQRKTDWKFECSKERSFVREFFLGASKCSLEEPDC